VGIVAALVLVLAMIDWNAMRGPVSRHLSARLDRDVRIDGDLDVSLFSWTPRATVNGLVVQQPGWVKEQNGKADTFAEIERLVVSVDLLELLTGDIVLPELFITRPDFRLIRDASGRANWEADPDAPDVAPRLPPIRHFVIEGGQLDLVDARKKLVLNGSFSSQEVERDDENSFQLDGKGELNRRPFTLKLTGDPLLNVDPDEPYGFKGDVRAGDTRVVADGVLSRPFNLGAFSVDVVFSGPDLAELYDLTGLALPNTPPYRVTGDLTRAGSEWRFEGFDGKIGDSDIRGTLNVDASGERSYLTGNVESRTLDFDDLGPVFGVPPSTGAGETASAEQKTDARRQQATARVLSDKPLDVVRLRQMDADVHYRADKVVSRDFPLRSADAQIKLANGILTLDPATMAFAQGEMQGMLRVDARKDTAVTDLDVRLSKLKLEQFVTGLGSPPALEGDLLARAKLHGTGNSVHQAASTSDGSFVVVLPRGQIRQSFAELLGVNIARAFLLDNRQQTDVRCAVAQFAAKDGVLSLNRLVFDTDVIRVSGQGAINMKTETVDLRLTGEPKQLRLVRVRGPITISGPIGRPQVGLDAKGVLGQGGLAAGLGALLSPFAALLPFVDPGLAEDANCAALLAERPVADASRQNNGR
jgi:uncharacterized protein involved in outer membrane biogenesis